MKTTIAGPGNYHHYNKSGKQQARKLRSCMTKAEKKFWQMIRKKNIHHCLFTRQRPVLDYIADFMCKELLLIIEVDGFYHDTPEQIEKDRVRDEKLCKAGFTILRFKNWEVLYSPDSVYLDIKNWIE